MAGIIRSFRFFLGIALTFSLWVYFSTAESSTSAVEIPLTVAERSQFASTSLYNDVIRFIQELQRRSPHIRVETLCRSTEGRDVPLLVLGNPLPASPDSLRHDPRGVVYIQANIHADEVEGKEASLMLARDTLLQKEIPYLENLILLIAPLFNADGNEKLSARDRWGEAGPERVGMRYNGQNLDLNRDSMKLESPELRGLLRNVLLRWDPFLVVDCHTTNGSYHEEPVTYSWPLNPNGDTAIITYMRDKMLPEIDGMLETKYQTLSIPYGGFKDAQDPEKGWQTFSPQSRFLTNYIGLRNRLAILNENYAYADFRTRIFGCYSFLRSILDYCSRHLEEINTLVREADRKTVARGLNPQQSDVFAVEFESKPLPEKLSIRSWEMEVIPREGTWPLVKKTDQKKIYTTPYFADFVGTKFVSFPFAYIISIPDQDVITKLLQHGILVEKLTEPAVLEVQSFRFQEINAGERIYQGHRPNSVKGEYTAEKKEFPAGTFFVAAAQPLGALAASLLEPESDDGLLAWNFFDRYIVPQWGRGFGAYPVHKLLKPVNLPRVTLRE